MPKYVTPKEAGEIFSVSVATLRRWEKLGAIKAVRTVGNQRRYIIEEAEKHSCIVCYARVSTHSQKDDLTRQAEFLRSAYPTAEVITEVGSGLNFKRRKFLAILERIYEGNIGTLVIAHADRLVRFGFPLIEWLCAKSGCELVVLRKKSLSPEQELVSDILSILHCFSARLYGLRKYEKQARQELQKETPSSDKPDDSKQFEPSEIVSL
ncbi:IS607 family transposase [Limnospira fusiformis KN01]|uniref:IS607 family transposase n=1 Tax=Limnospira fusiformis PMC 851.14 TaxID=2219512 RepID=A0ABU9EJF9_LIMFS|nr:MULTISPECIES: IS607 family transposase [Limnospira]MDC0839734.1 IS607 family transposase [Limnoraphis robusta]QJB29547.1 IS607 family transposase [Limnospira fusiformis SAG 85.79]QNH60225.1 MAG: IS607 family transposase [Limnospira indica BM01]ULB48280.1 IS607 family transposase [Limnospira fusiformis KN01]